MSRPDGEVILEGRGVSRYFGGLAAVKDVDFAIRRGEIFGLIGPNGAGKTTLFSVVTGVLSPSAGEVRFRGRVISGLQPEQVVKLGVCRTHQVVRPFRDLTVRENVLVAAHHGRAGRRALEVADEMLAFTGLELLAPVPAGALPIGQLKRLEIARALATQPDVLLCDEICGGLNPAETEATLSLLREIRRRGMTIFYIEHNMRAVMSVCDRIMVLNYGEKIAEGTPEEIAADERVITAYLGTRFSLTSVGGGAGRGR